MPKQKSFNNTRKYSLILESFLRNIRDIPIIIWGFAILALIIRLIGITYGLPLFLNPDEPTAISSAIGIKNSLNPGHFDWPHLYFYVNAILYVIFSLGRSLIEKITTLPASFYGSDPFFVVSRALSAVSASASVLAIYILSKYAFDKYVALITSLFLTFLPVHVYESHFAKPDVFQMLFLILALIFIVKIYKDKINISNYILAGVFIGISTSIKYGAALYFLPLLIAVYLKSRTFKEFINIDYIKMIIIAGISSIIAFYVFTPFALVDYQDFFSYKRGVGALWQIQNVGSVSWADYPTEIYETFVVMYRDSMGQFLWLFFIILVILYLFFNKRESKYILFLFPAILLSFYISKFERSPQHYFIMLIPLYLPAIAGFIKDSTEFFLNRVSTLNKYREKIIYIVAGLAVIPSIYSSYNISSLLSKEDTRTEAYKWVEQNLDLNNDNLYVIGEPLDFIDFKVRNSDKLTRLDVSQIKRPLPVYVIIGAEDIKENDILEGDRDPEKLEGNSSAILKNANLVFRANDDNRLGPPIYIFKVTSIAPND